MTAELRLTFWLLDKALALIGAAFHIILTALRFLPRHLVAVFRSLRRRN